MSDKIYNEEGLFLYNKKLYEEAIRKFNIAINLNPNEAYYYKNKGLCFFHLKKFKEAIDEYRNALRINPENASFHNNIGNAFSNLKTNEEAIEAYKKAIELDPNENLYKTNLNNVLKLTIKSDFQSREYKELSSNNDLIDLSTSINFSKKKNNSNIKIDNNFILSFDDKSFKDLKEKELERILMRIKNDPKNSDALIKMLFNEIKSCSSDFTSVCLDKFVCFIKGLIYENIQLKEKTKNNYDEKIHLKSEFENCIFILLIIFIFKLCFLCF